MPRTWGGRGATASRQLLEEDDVTIRLHDYETQVPDFSHRMKIQFEAENLLFCVWYLIDLEMVILALKLLMSKQSNSFPYIHSVSKDSLRRSRSTQPRPKFPRVIHSTITSIA